MPMKTVRLTPDQLSTIYSMSYQLRGLTRNHHRQCPCKLCDAAFILALDQGDDEPLAIYDVLFATDPVPTEWSK